MQTFKERELYAILPSASVFLLVIEQNDKKVTFMQLPDRYKVELDNEELNSFLQIRQLDYIEQLPSDVFEVCAANII